MAARIASRLSLIASCRPAPLAKGAVAPCKLADHRTDGFAQDARRFWPQIECEGSASR